MSTRFAKFAPANEAGAEALSSFLDAELPVGLAPWASRDEETGRLRRDQDGLWVVAYPYDGPFVFSGGFLPAPAGVAALTAAAVIMATANWPQEPSED